MSSTNFRARYLVEFSDDRWSEHYVDRPLVTYNNCDAVRGQERLRSIAVSRAIRLDCYLDGVACEPYYELSQHQPLRYPCHSSASPSCTSTAPRLSPSRVTVRRRRP